MRFFIADAFSEELFGGNPAGVVVLEKEGKWLSEETMVKTAAELRYSETAFVMPLADGTFRTRYFTPAAEVDLCGHATIATFTVLREAGLIGLGTYVNHTMAGDLEIRVSETSVLMEMGAPEIKGEITSDEELARLYGIMGLPDYHVHTKALYPKMVSTGLPDIMMPVADEAALDAITPDFPALTQLSKDYNVVGVHAFCQAKEENITAHARNFAPLYDIDEEAATGTSNGALTYYLRSFDLLAAKDEACIVQGEKMGRPSVIRTSIDGEKIMVGGSAVILAEGNINL